MNDNPQAERTAEDNRTSILQMARGAIQERIDYEMSRVVDNIMDPNTKPDAKRKLSLTIELLPDGERQTVFVSCTAKSTLCPTNPVNTSLYLSCGGKDGKEVTAVEMLPQIPGQVNMYGEVQDGPAVLKILRAE